MGALCCKRTAAASTPPSPLPIVQLGKRGPSVVVDDFTVTGAGTVVGSSQLLQNKAYWEVTVISTGAFCVGVTSSNDSLSQQLTERPLSSSLSSATLAQAHPLVVNDVLGLRFDLSGVKTILSFELNGIELPTSTISNIKGDQSPAVSVGDGAKLLVNFGQSPFQFGANAERAGFEAPMVVRSVM